MDSSNLPIIDWQQNIRFAGNQPELAKTFLEMLIKTLPQDVNLILSLYKQQEYSELLQKIHKLHGAVCYCGLPRLKKVLARLESDLKNNIMENLPSLLNQLETEFNLVLAHYAASMTAE